MNWQFTMWLDCQMVYHLGTLDKLWSGSCKSLGRSESWKWCGWAQSSVHQEPWEHENLVRIEQQLRLEDAKVRGMIFSLFRNIGEILVRLLVALVAISIGFLQTFHIFPAAVSWAAEATTIHQLKSALHWNLRRVCWTTTPGLWGTQELPGASEQLMTGFGKVCPPSGNQALENRAKRHHFMILYAIIDSPKQRFRRHVWFPAYSLVRTS